ncbi:MAG TPA: RNA polymerase sigma factor [Cryomorphaceae bacterium]|nr:RNA polymerase sigma factor [Cryomorphaceae bacterium]
MDENALAEACVEGDYLAQKRLYQLYAPLMMGVCMRYSSDKSDAEDILQDGFIKVYEKLDTFSGTGALGAWIRRIMVNTALQRYRANKNLQLVRLEDSTVHLQEVSDDALSSMSADELLIKIQRLPVGFRTVFNLYAIEGYKHNEIAEILGISVGTSKSQYSRSRALLREMIENENNFGERAI